VANKEVEFFSKDYKGIVKEAIYYGTEAVAIERMYLRSLQDVA
jgi:hypothetical protein